MFKKTLTFALIALPYLSITACGGVSDSSTNTASSGTSNTSQETDTKSQNSNNKPLAKAGDDQSVTVGQSVELDASASSDPDANLLTYWWTLESKPTDSQIDFKSTEDVKFSIKPDVSGAYVFKLFVHDGTEESSTTVTVNANKPVIKVDPKADAGSDLTVNTGDLVKLSGSGTDSSGLPEGVTYSWTLDSKPAGSVAKLINAGTKTPEFTPELDGNYVLSLIVYDNQVASSADTITVSAATPNAKPVSNAGKDQVQFDLSQIKLSGSATDADGNTLTYKWTIQSSPTGSSAVLANETMANASITPDVYGDYVFTLIANDGTVDSQPDNITVQVIDPAKKQDYLASKISTYQNSASAVVINGYVQVGSSYSLSVNNNSSQSINWTQVDIVDGNGAVFVTSTNSAVLSGGVLAAGEKTSIGFDLTLSSRLKPFTARFYWNDPLDANKKFNTTLVFAK